MQSKANATARTRRQAAPEASIFTREPLLLLGLLLACFYFGRPLLIPLALALTFNFLLTPLVTSLERLRFARTPAVLLVMVAATALLGGIVWLVAGQLLTVVNDLPSHAPNIRAKLDKTHVPANSALGQALVSMEGLSREFSNDPAEQDAQHRSLTSTATARARSNAGREAARKAALTGQAPELAQPTPVLVVQAPASELAYLRQLVRPIAAPLGTAGMVLIFTIYMLLKREDLRNRLLLLAGIGRLHLVSHALDDAGARISRYLIANVAVNTGFGIVFAGGLVAIGVPYASLWGTLLALLRTVPYVGPLVGGGVPTLFALIYFPTWWQAGCTIAFIALLEILVSNFLEPWLYGAHTGISELALLAMAILWTLLWGWPGLALSTPLTVCLIVIGRTMPQMSFLHILLGDDAELAPEARFYERMLALDQAEAHNVAERFLSPRGGAPRSPLEMYDAVLLPALALAENDRHKGLLTEESASFFLQSVAELVAELTTYAVHAPPVSVAALEELVSPFAASPAVERRSATRPNEAGPAEAWRDAETSSATSPLATNPPEAGPGATRPSAASPAREGRDATISSATSPLAANPDQAAGARLQDAGRCPVVCVPASDQADEIAATMLAQVLESSGHRTLLLPASALTPELLANFRDEPQTCLCLSALPPFAFTEARLLYQRLRLALPHNPILIGLWRSSITPELLRARFGMDGVLDQVATTLAAALLTLHRLEPGCQGQAERVPSADIYARSMPATASQRR